MKRRRNPSATIEVNSMLTHSILHFAKRHPGWHAYNFRDRYVEEAMRYLQRRQLIRINHFHQFTLGG